MAFNKMWYTVALGLLLPFSYAHTDFFTSIGETCFGVYAALPKHFLTALKTDSAVHVLMASKALTGTELSLLTISHNLTDFCLLRETCFELNQSS